MIGHLPKRPKGTSARVRFAQWVYDTLTGQARPQAANNQKVSATTRGFSIESKIEAAREDSQTVGSHLTDALWHPELERIYGVRGGYLVECDAAGKLLRTLCYGDPAMGDAYLTLHTDGKLWISHWYDPTLAFFSAYPPDPGWACNKGFYVLGPDVFANPVLYPFTEAFTTFSADPVAVPGVPPVPNLLERGTGDPGDLGDDGTEEVLATTTSGAIAYIDLHDAFPLADSPGEGSGSPAPYLGDILTIGPFEADCTMSAGPFRVYGGFKLNGVHQHGSIATFADIGSWILAIPAGEVVTIEIVYGFTNAGFPTQAEMETITGDPAVVQITRLSFFAAGVPSYDDDLINKWQFHTGPRRLLVDNDGLLWCTNVAWPSGTAPQNVGVTVFDGADPDTAAVIAIGGTFEANFENSGGNNVGPCALNCLTLDTDNNEVWVGTGNGIARAKRGADGAGADALVVNDVLLDRHVEITGGPHIYTIGVYGICYYGGRVFIATRSPIVYVVTLSDLSIDTIDIGLELANPRNLKVAFGRIWVPTMNDNRVVEIDVDSYVVEDVHDGFEQPWDIVATDSKVFAVQLGSPGLRLVR